MYRGPFWGRVMVFPRVVADRDVRDSDLETANLVLFGTRGTNAIIERFGGRLPIHLDSALQRYGLVYVYPMNDRYVLVNSGLPWWEAGPAGSGSPFTGSVVAFQLAGFEDYLLFEGSTDNVVARGRFDNDWRVPASDAQAMLATGIVSVPGQATDVGAFDQSEKARRVGLADGLTGPMAARRSAPTR